MCARACVHIGVPDMVCGHFWLKPVHLFWWHSGEASSGHGSCTSFNVPPTYFPTYFLDNGDENDDSVELRGNTETICRCNAETYANESCNAETYAKATKGKAISETSIQGIPLHKTDTLCRCNAEAYANESCNVETYANATKGKAIRTNAAAGKAGVRTISYETWGCWVLAILPWLFGGESHEKDAEIHEQPRTLQANQPLPWRL